MTKSKRYMLTSEINWKAIVLGSFCGGICLNGGDKLLHGLLRDMFRSPHAHEFLNLFTCTIFLAPVFMVSGYVVASIAKSNIRAHANFVCALYIISGLFGVASSITNVWMMAVGILLLLVVAVVSNMLGVYIAQKKLKEAAYYAPGQIALAALIGGLLPEAG